MSVGHKAGVRKLRWTAKQFYKLADKGLFRGRRVELIDGVIYEMTPQTNLHAQGIGLSHNALVLAFGPGYWVRGQMPIDMSPFSVLDPDVAVVKGNIRDFGPDQSPTSAVLIVEVSLTTLGYDRHRKASIYARAGIQDYWILNLRRRQLEVRRQPGPDLHSRYGFGYASLTTFGPNESVTSLAAPQTSVAVADLLP